MLGPSPSSSTRFSFQLTGAVLSLSGLLYACAFFFCLWAPPPSLPSLPLLLHAVRRAAAVVGSGKILARARDYSMEKPGFAQWKTVADPRASHNPCCAGSAAWCSGRRPWGRPKKRTGFSAFSKRGSGRSARKRGEWGEGGMRALIWLISVVIVRTCRSFRRTSRLFDETLPDASFKAPASAKSKHKYF